MKTLGRFLRNLLVDTLVLVTCPIWVPAVLIFFVGLELAGWVVTRWHAARNEARRG